MFNEKFHAMIPAVYYKYLMDKVPEKGEQIFIFATERYGYERGARMAQRVLRDGGELNFANYVRYGEWEPTEGMEHTSELLSITPDYSYHIKSCPWHDQFVASGAGEAGKVYCTYLDKAIARGYNPRLEFQVNSTLHVGQHCEFVLKDAYLDRQGDLSKDKSNVMSWEYHCAHIFQTFARVVHSTCGEEAGIIVNSALLYIAEVYGKEPSETIMKYNETDFSLLA